MHHAPPECLDHLLDLPPVEHLQPAQLPGTPVGDRQQQPATAYQDAPQLPNRQGEVALIRLPVVATSRVESAVIETDMLQSVPEDIRKQIVARIPLGRFGTAEDVALAVRYLVCDAPWMTGSTFDLNGGQYM